MRTLAAVTPDPPLAAAAARLAGRVAVVHADPATDGGRAVESADEPAGQFTVEADGAWRGQTSGDGFRELLDRLAPTYDYALIGGRSGLRLSTVAPDGADPAGPVVRRLSAPLDPDRLAAVARDVEPYVTLETLVAACKRSPDEDRAGAIATFTGRVRAKDGPEDVRTTHLEFDRYDRVAADRLDELEATLADREGVFDVQTHHRTGLIEAGEDIVFVVVLAGHREQAFRAVSDGIDRLKREVPIFKKEITTEDAAWKHEGS